MRKDEWKQLRVTLRARGIEGADDLRRFVSNTEYFAPSTFDERSAMHVLLEVLPQLSEPQLVTAVAVGAAPRRSTHLRPRARVVTEIQIGIARGQLLGPPSARQLRGLWSEQPIHLPGVRMPRPRPDRRGPRYDDTGQRVLPGQMTKPPPWGQPATRAPTVLLITQWFLPAVSCG